MLYNDYPMLAPLAPDIDAAAEAIVDCYRAGGKLLTAGNGGSAADADHIVGELMKGFTLRRPIDDPRIPPDLAQNLQGALPAVCLSSGLALPTAFANDCDGAYTVAQALYGLAKPGDVALLLSTSGNAENLVHAARLAAAIGVKTVAMTGRGGGKLAAICDITIRVPADETYRVQELHLPIYHALCRRVEHAFFAI